MVRFTITWGSPRYRRLHERFCAALGSLKKKNRALAPFRKIACLFAPRQLSNALILANICDVAVSVDQRIPIAHSLVPQICATEVPVSCVDQDSVLATVCNSVSRTVFSGKRVLELWPTLSGSVDVSEAFGCCSDSGDSCTIQQPH